MASLSLWTVILCGVLARGFAAQSNHGYICFPAIFSFGDDWADTGNSQALYPSELEALEEDLPYGISFFRKPAHRLSDGRLMLDFFAQALGMPLVSSYAVGVVPNLHHGVSFAVAGSAASSTGSRQIPYSLMLQVQWLQKFQTDVMDALTDPSVGTTQPLPSKESFQDGLYIISAGQNDYRYATIRYHQTVSEVEQSVVPAVVENITASVIFLSTHFGSKNFMVMNLPPLGCLPEFLTRFASADSSDYDVMGCLVKYNRISNLHNELLRLSITELRESFQGLIHKLMYVDMAALVSDVLYDPEMSGFARGLQACCGAGEPYNYNPNVPCGRHGYINGRNITASACLNPGEYVNWDGLHTTEAFNRIAVEAILTGHYIEPQHPLNCDFNFEEFNF